VGPDAPPLQRDNEMPHPLYHEQDTSKGEIAPLPARKSASRALTDKPLSAPVKPRLGGRPAPFANDPAPLRAESAYPTVPARSQRRYSAGSPRVVSAGRAAGSLRRPILLGRPG